MQRSLEPAPYPVDFRRALRESLPAGVDEPAPRAIEAMERHARLLLHFNPRFHLTSIDDPAEVVRRHFAEPLVALPFLEADGTLLDFGTGGGFPGLPMHVARGGGAPVLVEASSKKTSFLEIVVDRASIEGVRVVTAHPRRPSDMTAYAPAGTLDALTLRAVPGPETRLDWLRILLRPGGVGLFFLGSGTADAAERAAPEHALEVVARVALPRSRSACLLVLRKR